VRSLTGRVGRHNLRVILAVALVALPIAASWSISSLPARHESHRRAIDAPAKRGGVYASQTGSRLASRQADVRWSRLETKDSASEICEGRSTGDWARLLGVAADRAVVAREFAVRNYDPSHRAAARDGCFAGLHDAD
jgi:hypothetical protein